MSVVRADELPCYLALRVDYEDGGYGETTAVNVVGLHDRGITGRVEHGEGNTYPTSDIIGTCQIVDTDRQNFGVLGFELVVFSLQIT